MSQYFERIPICSPVVSYCTISIVSNQRGQTDLAGARRRNRHNLLLRLMKGVDHVHVVGHGLDGIVRCVWTFCLRWLRLKERHHHFSDHRCPISPGHCYFFESDDLRCLNILVHYHHVSFPFPRLSTSVRGHSEDANVGNVIQEESCYLSMIHLHICSQGPFLTVENDWPGDDG